MESKFFTEAISRRRLAAGLTQDALAQKAGINRTTYGSIERGQRALSSENLVRLSIALETRVEDILSEAYQVHFVSLLQIEHEVRRKLGMAPRAGEEKPKDEPLTAIHSFVDSLKDLLLLTVPSSRKKTPAFSPSLTPPSEPADKPRRRARRPSGPRQPRRR